MLRNCLIVAMTCVVFMIANRVGSEPEKEPADVTEGAQYVGEKSCKKCHFKEHRSWKKSEVYKHADAWNNLKPHLKSPDQKDSQGRLCVSCHVTGHSHPDRGGFVSEEKSGHLLAVQCEACHGPGSNHIKAGQAVRDAKRKKFEEGEKSYINKNAVNCTRCHNPHHAHDKLG